MSTEGKLECKNSRFMTVYQNSKDHIVFGVMPFLCFIELFALSITCKDLLKHKPIFEAALRKFIRKTDFEEDSFFRGLSLGLRLTGSILHQVLYGQVYKGADIDIIRVGRKYVPTPTGLKRRTYFDNDPRKCDILAVMNPGTRDRTPYYPVVEKQRLGYQNPSKGGGLHSRFPVESRKKRVVRMDNEKLWAFMKQHEDAIENYWQRLTMYVHKHKAEFPTIFEHIEIKHTSEFTSVFKFIDPA